MRRRVMEGSGLRKQTLEIRRGGTRGEKSESPLTEAHTACQMEIPSFHQYFTGCETTHSLSYHFHNFLIIKLANSSRKFPEDGRLPSETDEATTSYPARGRAGFMQMESIRAGLAGHALRKSYADEGRPCCWIRGVGKFPVLNE
jgi:hypothetical protein